MTEGTFLDETFLKQLKAQATTDPHSAYDAAAAALRDRPHEIALRHIQAVALIQTGSLRAALDILDALYAAGQRDAETLGLLGSAWKRQAETALSPESRQAALEKARDFYFEGLTHAEMRADASGYYPGINAAALTLLLRDEVKASSLAARAVALAERAESEDYWVIATKAEAALIQRDFATARKLYLRAAERRPSFSHLATTRRQARQIASALSVSSGIVDDCLPVPPVFVFAGHMTDAPSRPQPRFPEELTENIAGRVRAALQHNGAALGLASAARGGDLLFLEALEAEGVDQHVVLPLDQETFRAASVFGGDPAWEKRFTQALTRAKSLHIANTHSSTADGAAFEYGTRILLGLARLHAQRLDTDLRGIVVWDGATGDGLGGTEWAVNYLLSCGVPIENVYPGREGRVKDVHHYAPTTENSIRDIRAMLFADCKGYSKLREEQVAEFTKGFLSGVARLIERLRKDNCVPLVANTWGDGLFMVFEDVRAAGLFAAALRDGVRRRAEALGIPKGVAVRIGLHAGPVTPFFDPITQRNNFAGQNVAFAARIEPIAPENQVCVSEAFAALAAEAGPNEFRFDYLGTTPFAKNFGHYPLYQLHSLADSVD
jgi:class 3 adenylate cyclase